MYNNKKPDPKKRMERIKKYYEEMNKDPKKVEVYVKKTIIEMLSERDRAKYDIKEKIYKNINKEKHEKIVEENIKRFEDLKYIDDERFSDVYIRTKYYSGYGETYIKNKLKEKKIDENTIVNILEKYDFEESLKDYIDKKFSKSNHNNPKELKKIITRLMNRGFAYSSIKLIFEELKDPENNEKYEKIEPKSQDKEKFLKTMRRKLYGKNKIRQEARIKGVEIVESDLDDFDFYEISRNYKEKKYGTKKELDVKIKQKMINHMMARGFSYDEIKESME